jgi:alcohol dehydrogenase class IV
MNNPIFYMPTKIICEEKAIKNHRNTLCEMGNKALIVTGYNSSKINGSLEDITSSLKALNIDYLIFDKVEENPTLDTVEKITVIGRENGVDFIIGVGGGSPIDAAKAAAVLINNKEANLNDLFTCPMLTALPVVAIPTTAGTGTEATPYAILTDHNLQTKRGIAQKVFPLISFLDPTYLMNTPKAVTINTAVDALSHLIEGYLSTNSNLYSDGLAENGLNIFGECIKNISENNISIDIRKKLLISSCIAGIVISQAGTSLPHGMGYALTYYKNVPHGKANGILLESYLNFCEDKEKVKSIINYLGFNSLETLGAFLTNVLGEPVELTDEEMVSYAEAMASNEAKLKNHPSPVTYEDILDIYKNSLKRI